jgi:thermitase
MLAIRKSFGGPALAGAFLTLVAALAPAQPANFVPGRVLVKFSNNTPPGQSRSAAAALGAQETGEISRIGVKIFSLPPQANEHAVLNALRRRPDVQFAELDVLVRPGQVSPNDPNYASQWHLPKISAPSAWSSNTGASSIIIAICDTGVDGTHEDLAGKMVPGRNIYNGNSDTADVHGHGTQVAGTAAAVTNNARGVAGVSWGSLIMPVRVSDPNGYASYSNMAAGITWAADNGARVANLSYMASNSAAVMSASNYMNSRGGVVTISAGNYSTNEAAGDNPYVLTVSATDGNDALYSWSNYGNNIDVAAPGCVTTTYRGGGYGGVCGTSFSAPITAGVAALVLSANPSLTAVQAMNIIKQSSDDLGPAGWDITYGAGRVNASRAVTQAAGSPAPDTQAPTVSFLTPANGAALSGVTAIQANASDNVGIASVKFFLDGVLQTTLASAPYNWNWGTTTASNGAHTLTATAADAAGNQSSSTISVSVVNNASDTQPPTVTILSPSAGSKVKGTVSVPVNASDNVGVVRAQLFVNGALTHESVTAPFTTKWSSNRSHAGSYTLQVKVFDAAGNVGFSQLVPVTK